MKDFCHLHVHTQYSLLDGTIKIPELIKRVKELGMSSCAITDHGNLFGALEFYKAAKQENIKPIIGMEAYITFDPDGLSKEECVKDNYHLVILAKNNIGLKNLFWLSSNAYLNNFYYKPRVSWESLLDRNEGLIITSACLGSVTARGAVVDAEGNIKRLGGMYDKTHNQFIDYFNCLIPRILTLKEVFKDRFYIELQPHDMWEQDVYNTWIIKQALKYNIEMIITTDAHYLTEKEKDIHALIHAQLYKQTIDEYKKGDYSRYSHGGYYIKTIDEMVNHAKKLTVPESIENTIKIANECTIDIELGKFQFPKFNIQKCQDYREFLEWKQSL